ncbi:chromosome segregation protein SMC [Acinetobacter sp.]|uniref:chromosome segregation protein SMC n=1 Tax=Acinetobacter sp. TaxID=472 RepID=UPI00388F6F32
MRLSSLKLSGFKSFADSSTLHFKANRTAVVGPNGCGKSNVIDAIRWVMGESSARQLRGGTMQDVIFTGTAKRKPVGVASVELRFDNTYGKLGGMYNAYTELSVRRQVNREGKSEYFLNGTKCRRRDITDIFLGTGLGPRSYAIIEQGMINRLVDAKPDEMRVYIEEAAGVSRYQARRRETLTHLEHTTQNLARLEDIRLELAAQLKTLKRQADAALQYQQLDAHIRTLKIEVLSCQYGQSVHLQQQYNADLQTLTEQFKLIRAELSTLEQDLSTSTTRFQGLMQQSMPLQQQWQSAEQQLAALKSQLQHKQQLLSQNQQQLTQLDAQKQQYQQRLQLLDVQLDTLITQQDQAQTQYNQYADKALEAQQQCRDLKAQQQQIEQQFQVVKTQVDIQQQQQLQLYHQVEQLKKNIQRQQQQIEMLNAQLHALSRHEQQHDVLALARQKTQFETSLKQCTEHITACQSVIATLENTERDLQQQLQSGQNQIQLLQREQQQLQQSLPKTASHTTQQPTLLDTLQFTDAAKPYAALLEKFLNHWLTSQVNSVQMPFAPNIARQIKVSDVTAMNVAGLAPLSTWIIEPQHSLLNSVALADNLEQALKLQDQLSLGQSILSLDGYHVGQDWLIALDYQTNSATGLTQRLRCAEIEEELKLLVQEIAALKPRRAENLNQLFEAKGNLKQQQANFEQMQQQYHQLTLTEVKQQTAQQAFALQQQQLSQQLSGITAQIHEDQQQYDALNLQLQAIHAELAHKQPQYKTLQFQLETGVEAVEQAEKTALYAEQDVHSATRRVNELAQHIELLNKDLSFLTTQCSQISAQIQQTHGLIEPLCSEIPALNAELTTQQTIVNQLKQQWQAWQQQLNSLQTEQQHLTEQRQAMQQNDEQLRQQLEQTRLAWQAAKSDAAHYMSQLDDMDAAPLQISVDLQAKQHALEQAQQRFAKLGAVNFAASEEYSQVLARYAELQHQMQDLDNTVVQLQSAMKSIDQETRTLFMQTFDQVNHELAQLFPKVFNGGEAHLSLESDWQSGVKLMARPPGKRNSSLALLSGGEKALTALALVFAIFRLNPAPFCVLDEVDAPLDDANVGRFCHLVKELSEQVQFIYITHNKLAMTMATDLLGVTMPEPGASKLVTVNLEQAEKYLVAES